MKVHDHAWAGRSSESVGEMGRCGLAALGVLLERLDANFASCQDGR